MTAIGETLRRERLRRNLDLQQISQELKISPRFLDAIEAEQFNKLPGGVFAKSFVRQYARLMGLDEEEMAAEVQRILEPAPEPVPQAPAILAPAPYAQLPRMHAWESVGDGKRFRWSSPLASLALVVAAILISSGIYTWWQGRRSAVVPAESATTVAAPAPAAQTPPVQSATAAAPKAATPVTPPAAVQPGASGSADRGAPELVSPAVGSQSAAIAPASLQGGAGAVAGDPNAPVQVQLTAEEPVWVRVRSGGKYLFSGTLEANQTRTVDGAGTVELLLGNAGGMQITLNGKPIGSVGPKGQVRTVQLTPGGFRIVPPTPSVPLDPL
jgi:cytoskeleton protein RodZ